jgi:hypothetical protein
MVSPTFGPNRVHDSKGIARPDYVSVTVRVPAQVEFQVRGFAKAFGWHMSDALRVFSCIGATFFFLTYGNKTKQEAATSLLDGMKLLRFFRSFSLNFSERPYALRLYGRKSKLMTLSLPQSLCEVIAAYASLEEVSRNQVYNKCLQQGLLIYLKAQAGILKVASQE